MTREQILAWNVDRARKEIQRLTNAPLCKSGLSRFFALVEWLTANEYKLLNAIS